MNAGSCLRVVSSLNLSNLFHGRLQYNERPVSSDLAAVNAVDGLADPRERVVIERDH